MLFHKSMYLASLTCVLALQFSELHSALPPTGYSTLINGSKYPYGLTFSKPQEGYKGKVIQRGNKVVTASMPYKSQK